MMMTTVFLIAATALLLSLLPYLARAIKGPTVFDRLISLNAMGTKIAVLMVLVGLLYGRADLFIDLALALFLLNLVATLLVARYVREQRKQKREWQ
jgi:multicomponent Na+:H+ antiporter subunit F